MCKQATNTQNTQGTTNATGTTNQTGTSSNTGTSTSAGTSTSTGTTSGRNTNVSQSGTENISTGFSQTVLPEFVKAGGQDAVRMALTRAQQPTQAYTAPRVADFSGDTSNAFQLLRQLTGQTTGSTAGQTATQGAMQYAQAGPQRVGYEGTFDAGDISKYVNPYVDAALTPALAKIQEASDAARKRLSAGATSARAFGDARHGIAEADLNASTSQAIGDTASQFMMNAFDRAVGVKQGDLGRKAQTEGQNAAFNEQALNRLFQGTAAPLSQEGQQQQQQLQAIQALLASGQLQTGQQQAGLDANYQEFLRRTGMDAANIDQLVRTLSSIPIEKGQASTGTQTGTQTGMQTGTQTGTTNQTGATTNTGTTQSTGNTSSSGTTSSTGNTNQTTTTQTPDNALLGLLGAAAGAFLGGPAGAQIGAGLFGGGGGGATTTPGTAANGGWTTTTTPAAQPSWLAGLFNGGGGGAGPMTPQVFLGG